jgi:hypothetical protein
MPKTAVFTTITPLPAGITRKSVLDMYRDHLAMIDLNPLVVERFKCRPPSYAPTDEYWSMWYTIKGTTLLCPPSIRSMLTSCRQGLISTWRPGDRVCIISRLLQRHGRGSSNTRIRASWSRHPREVDGRRKATWRTKAPNRAWTEDTKTWAVYSGRRQDDLLIAPTELRQEDVQRLTRKAC